MRCVQAVTRATMDRLFQWILRNLRVQQSNVEDPSTYTKSTLLRRFCAEFCIVGVKNVARERIEAERLSSMSPNEMATDPDFHEKSLVSG